jgi:XapX domain-containing protein
LLVQDRTMKITASFMIALAIGAISRRARIPSLAPQGIVGALLIVAMTARYVLTDKCLVAQTSLKVSPIGEPLQCA